MKMETHFSKIEKLGLMFIEGVINLFGLWDQNQPTLPLRGPEAGSKEPKF